MQKRGKLSRLTLAENWYLVGLEII